MDDITHVTGFPSPAHLWRECRLSLDALLLPHPDATYFVQVHGRSMEGAGIFDGSLLVVDRALEPTHESIIIAVLRGAFTVKRLVLRHGQRYLTSAHPRYPSFSITDDMHFEVWGVVTWVLHPLSPGASLLLGATPSLQDRP